MAVHSYGFEKAVTVCSASVTCGKATFISPIQVEHSALAFEAAHNQSAVGSPKPKELDKTTRTSDLRQVLGTRSRSQPSSGLSRLIVGGSTPSRMASSEKIASTAPAAPSKCPVMDLVLLIASRAA